MSNNIFVFVLLAFCTNTIIPIPFEAVLLFFISKNTASTITLVFLGSLCAAAGGFVDLGLAGFIRRRSKKRYYAPTAEAGIRFYASVFLIALLPIPFSIVRVSLLKIEPRGTRYAAAIFLGRFPRYLLFTKAIQVSELPVVLLILISFAGVTWICRRYMSVNPRIPCGV